jgi:hypothetical protein
MEYVKDPLTQEIDAMAIIGQLLGKLPDAAARRRVLTWAVERYGAEVVAAQTQGETQGAGAPSVGDDASLAVGSDIFEAPASTGGEDLKSFASEFRRFADKLKDAAA